MSEIPHRLDAAFNTYTGKLLRKLKVLLLRLDNTLAQQLKKISAEKTTSGLTGQAEKKIDFKEIAEEKTDNSSAE